MPTHLPSVSQKPRFDGPQRLLVVMSVLGAAVATASILWLPGALVLPAVSVAMVSGAAACGAAAWWRAERRLPDRIGSWDIAGALALIGICAALLGDPEQALPLFEAGRLR
jgi:ABC-type xylose transport system permease subunit